MEENKEYLEHRTEKACRWIECRRQRSGKASGWKKTFFLAGETGLILVPVTEMGRTKNGVDFKK